MGQCRNKAGRKQKHTALGAYAPLQRKGWQILLSVLSRLKGAVSNLRELTGNSAGTTDVACCTKQGMMATCAEVNVLAQVTTLATPPKAWLLQ